MRYKMEDNFMKEKKNSVDDMSRTRTIYTTTPHHSTPQHTDTVNDYCKFIFDNSVCHTKLHEAAPHNDHRNYQQIQYTTPHYITPSA